MNKHIKLLTFIFWSLLLLNSPLMADLKHQKQEVQTTQEINQYCPVTPEEPIDKDIFTEYKGKKIYFCCKKCRRDFKKNPEKYLANSNEIQETAHQHQDTENHSHNSAKSEKSFFTKILDYLGRFHPLIVHFPIALILIAAFAESLRWFLKYEILSSIAAFNLRIGALSAVVAATLGWFLANAEKFPPEQLQTLFLHLWLGVATAIFSVITAILHWQASKKQNKKLQLYSCISLAVVVILVSLASHFGASLIYGTDWLLNF